MKLWSMFSLHDAWLCNVWKTARVQIDHHHKFAFNLIYMWNVGSAIHTYTREAWINNHDVSHSDQILLSHALMIFVITGISGTYHVLFTRFGDHNVHLRWLGCHYLCWADTTRKEHLTAISFVDWNSWNLLVDLGDNKISINYSDVRGSRVVFNNECCFTPLCDWFKNSRHLLNQSDAKQKPIIATWSYAFFRAWRRLHVLGCHWFIVLFIFAVIGHCNCFGFGFTTLNWKPLYYHAINCLFDYFLRPRPH